MPRYRVVMQVDGMIYVEVDAADEASAKEQARAMVAEDDWAEVFDVDRLAD